MENNEKIVKLKKPRKTPVVIELPTGSLAMEYYLDKYRRDINDTLIDSFDYAVKKRFGGIELFCFENSNYIIIVNDKDFRDNIQNIFDYSLKNEDYDICAKAKKVMELLDRHKFVISFKKNKPNNT
jgi:hypothetical protein